MKNKELKKELHENGKYNIYRQTRRNLIIESSELDKTDEILKYILPDFTDEELKECERLRNNFREQRKKIQDHLEYLFKRKDYRLYFMTFTFNDQTLSTTSKETRRRKIVKTLNPCEDYFYNIDFGAENDREHYHAVIAVNKSDKQEYKDGKHIRLKCFDDYTAGFYYAERIRTDETSKAKISKYITKLTFHSVKVEQQNVSAKRGSDYQLHKKQIKELKDESEKRGVITENMINERYKYLDKPNQTKFKEHLKSEENKPAIQTTFGDIKLYEVNLKQTKKKKKPMSKYWALSS